MPLSEMSGLTPLAFAFGGPTDIAIIAVVVLVLFGSTKIATLGKSLGDGIREFKKATKDEEEPTPTPVSPQPTPVATASAKDEEK